ncbi:Iron-regulated protein FrpC [Planktothrix tepida]|uniref:Uncharacterized protein n=2 Tax=Planktothrix TaxID=54304 RepID=A0A1J1LJK0_9CYAN|nr:MULTISPECIES: hypothetical protein [Planktothrix]CAD5933802.1 Iron-regulated protein FrpC [Planktothrix tepida]CAD5977312.1 Iron-regulated protein FrpC [Planktothrix pseudagardhii]CUR31753.1 hypothetical protein PL9214291346 [Planktothrix tepida PCC 9214]
MNNDQLTGGQGNDVLVGAEGIDSLTGGEGSDRFVLIPGYGSDLIMDFQEGQDLLVLNRGLTFEQISIIPSAEGVSIQVGLEILALLPGVNINLLTVEDFVSSVI